LQALILAGGEGTRLRPLTSTVPKPVLPLANRPFISYMIDWLGRHGVDDIVMSCGFLAEEVQSVLGDGDGRIRLRYIEEESPLDTAGAVKLAEDLLDERFWVLNGDILADFDLSAIERFHSRHEAVATIALVRVDDPSAYGLVRTDADGRITGFLEKPSPEEIDTDLVNGGAYMLERAVLDRIEVGAPTSFERDVFPALVGAGLCGCAVEGYWLDIGTPERYLAATFDILDGKVETSVAAGTTAGGVTAASDAEVDVGADLVAPALLGSGARVEAGARVGGHAVICDGASVGHGASVERSVVLAGGSVGAGASVRGSIVGIEGRIGEGAQLRAAIVGERASVAAGAVLPEGARVEPGVSVPEGSATRLRLDV
jgi:mannose-1-phosphate guanylyltransferase